MLKKEKEITEKASFYDSRSLERHSSSNSWRWNASDYRLETEDAGKGLREF